MSRRTARRLAWAAPALTSIGFMSGALFGKSPGLDEAFFAAIALTLGVVGALVAARVPRNPIGWILCGVSVYAGAGALADGYVTGYLAGEGGTRGLAETAAWFSNWVWIPLVLVPLAFLPVYFPTGRTLPGRWRIVPWVAGGGVGLFAFSQAFQAGVLEDYEDSGIVNPYGIDHPLVEVLAIGLLATVAAMIASAASTVVRFRRARGIERQQIKWLAYAVSFAVGGFIVGSFVGGLWSEDVANAIILVGVTSIPVAIGLAMLRYRLYDLDVVINRTMVYGVLTATLAGAYGATVLLLQLVLSPGSDLAIAASTLAVAALFRPARSHIQAGVDRRFYRGRYDAQQTLEGFGARLRDEVELDALSAQLRDVVARTLQPAHVSLWLRRPEARP